MRDRAEIALRTIHTHTHAQFVGGEIAGKTLAVLGLGNIGALVAECAIALGEHLGEFFC